MPAGNSRAGVGFLMTRRTVQGGNTFAFRTAHHIGKMTMAIVTLLRVIRRGVTVNAAWMRQNGIDLLPRDKAVRPRAGRPRWECGQEEKRSDHPE